MPWTYRITRAPADGEALTCFAAQGAAGPAQAQPCGGDLRYRIEAIDPDTGEVRTQHACTKHAAWLAHQVGHVFPPNTHTVARTVPA